MTVRCALVLAGSRGQVDPVAAHAGVAHKALITVQGEPLLRRVLEALRGAGVERLVVSTSDAQVAELAQSCAAQVLPAAASPSLSVQQGVEALGTPLLVTTSDHALLEAEWIRRFVADAPEGADICVLLARRDLVEAAGPGTRRTYLRFADGEWSGCNLFLVRTERALSAVALWRQVEADRKRPWRIVRRLGPVTLLTYLAGRLTLADAVARLGGICGVRAAAVASPFGLAAVDVDKPSDLDLVRERLGA